MVYCTKCGTQNPDNAEICSKCGARLNAIGDREYHKRVENECFGLPHGGMIVAAAIGAIIFIWGLILILQEFDIISTAVSWWPIALIIFGVVIVVGAIYGMQRRRY